MDYLHEINGIFNRFIVDKPSGYWQIGIPEGYRLVETEEHKRERLISDIQQKRKMLSYHEKAIAALSSQIETEEQEILGLPK